MAQRRYGFSTPMGGAGGIVDIATYEINTFLNEEETGVMKHGVGVVAGSNPGANVKLPAAGAKATDFLGVVVNNRTTELDLEGGLHIKKGANNNSSDADIDTVNIVGNNKAGSMGVYCIGFDNTFTNMRIANVQTGVRLEGAGNFLRNIHPLMTYGGMEYEYKDSIGFDDASGGNWYDFCYSDQFAVGFRMTNNTLSTYQTCFCFWYKLDVMQVGFKSVKSGNPAELGKMNSTIWNSKVNLNNATVAEGVVVPEGTNIVRTYLQAATGGGGRIECAIFNKSLDNVGTYSSYLKTATGSEVMWPK